jgi:hypothetical protein
LLDPQLPVLVAEPTPAQKRQLMGRGFVLRQRAPGLVTLAAGDCAEPRLPRAVVVHGLLPCSSEQEAIAAMTDPAFDPRRQMVVQRQGLAVVRLPPLRVPAEIDIVSWQDHRAELTVEVGSDGWLVLTDFFPSPWRIWVDGVASDSWPVNIVHRGLPIAAGRHRVVLADTAGTFSLWRWLRGSSPPLDAIAAG